LLIELADCGELLFDVLRQVNDWYLLVADRARYQLLERHLSNV
jgi:hypothetical protein